MMNRNFEAGKECSTLWVPVSGRLKFFLWVLLVPGFVLFLVGGVWNQETRIWQIYLVNLLFWSGFAQTGVVISAMWNVANGKWGRNLQHIVLGLTLFCPVSFGLFLVLFVGAESVFSWIGNPIPEKGLWLDITHLFVREVFNLLFLNILNAIFLYFSLRPEAGLLVERDGPGAHPMLSRIARGWNGIEKEKKSSESALRILSPILLLVYVIVYSMIAYDFVMSLDPHWYSTLFGAYYFMTNLYLGLAGVTLIALLLSFVVPLERHVGKSQYQDLGTLIFAFCMISLDFFWSQYLVIWYGNIPEEISFLVKRINEEQWRPFTLAVLGACFVVPFVTLLNRIIKRSRRLLLPVVLLIFLGVWLERYVLIVPTVWKGDNVPLGFPEVAISLSFLGGFVLVYLAFLQRVPLLPSDARREGPAASP